MQQVHALRIMTPSSSLPTPTRRCLQQQQQQHTRPRPCLEKLVRPTWVTLNMASSKSSTAAAATTTTTMGNNNNKNNKVIQNVAIVGAGIAGLTVAHGLVNSPNLRHSYDQSPQQSQQEQNFHVSLFDARSCLDTTAGAGVQLNGGLVILGKINPIVQQAVIDAGLPQVAVQSRTKSWKQSSSSSSSSSSYDQLFQLNLSQAVKNNINNNNNNNNNKSMGMQSLLDEETGQLLWTAIMRGALQQALVDTLPLQSSSLSSSFSSNDEKNNNKNKKNKKNPSSPPPPSITLEFGKRVVNIQPMDNKNDNKNKNNNNTGALLEFADGTKAGPFDLSTSCVCCPPHAPAKKKTAVLFVVVVYVCVSVSCFLFVVRSYCLLFVLLYVFSDKNGMVFGDFL